MTITVTLDAAGTRTSTVPPELSLVEPLAGIPGVTRFSLAALDESGLLFTLRATGAKEVRLFVMSPAAYFPAYAPEVSDAVAAALGLGPDQAAVTLTVVHPGVDEPTSVNLLAPLLVNAQTGAALQVVLEGDWRLRTPLTAEPDASTEARA